MINSFIMKLNIQSIGSFLIICIMTVSCNNASKYEIVATDKYEKSKESLAEQEQNNPARFLTVTGTDKKNLFGQTVVKGIIFNKAKIVSYKDVELRLSFYSKTGTLLEQDKEVIYETIPPGGSKRFKSKYFTPKGTDSVSLIVTSAKY